MHENIEIDEGIYDRARPEVALQKALAERLGRLVLAPVVQDVREFGVAKGEEAQGGPIIWDCMKGRVNFLLVSPKVLPAGRRWRWRSGGQAHFIPGQI